MDINWMAVAVAALAYYLLGALWFTPLFGRSWDRSIGYDRATGGRFPPSYYIVPLVAAIVGSVLVAALAAACGADSALDGLLVGAAVGVVGAAISVNNALTPHTPEPFVLGTVTGGYHVVGLAVVGVIVGAWR